MCSKTPDQHAGACQYLQLHQGGCDLVFVMNIRYTICSGIELQAMNLTMSDITRNSIGTLCFGLNMCCLALLLLLLLLLCPLVSAFSPLEGFMNQAEYDNVVHNMRLTVSDGCKARESMCSCGMLYVVCGAQHEGHNG
jgi:hypothetical protein